jgi:hypothetical protein
MNDTSLLSPLQLDEFITSSLPSQCFSQKQKADYKRRHLSQLFSILVLLLVQVNVLPKQHSQVREVRELIPKSAEMFPLERPSVATKMICVNSGVPAASLHHLRLDVSLHTSAATLHQNETPSSSAFMKNLQFVLPYSAVPFTQPMLGEALLHI